jgi:hypothetical protein
MWPAYALVTDHRNAVPENQLVGEAVLFDALPCVHWHCGTELQQVNFLVFLLRVCLLLAVIIIMMLSMSMMYCYLLLCLSLPLLLASLPRIPML